MYGIFFGSLILLIAGMAPTWVAYFVERRPGNHGTTCILLFNLAGLIPVLSLLWSNSSGGGFSAVANLNSWLIIYSTAAIGAGLVWLAPHFTLIYARAYAIKKRSEIKSCQEELYKEWGSSILE